MTMSERFLTNTWYMAGWKQDLKPGGLLARTIIDIPVVVALTEDGESYALYDRCPHRFAPLARGKVTPLGIECGYHGLTFDAKGQCVANPLGEVTPKACHVRSFPVHIQDEIIWVWMGDPDKADKSAIPRLPCFADQNLRFVFGITDAKADYQLLVDNLLDLTHAVFLHPAFGNPTDRPKFTLERQGETIYAKYVVNDVPISRFLEPLWDSKGKNVDLWDDIRWDAPGVHYLESGVVTTGRPHEEGLITPAVHVVTPHSAGRTTYFWASAVANNAEVSNEELHEGLRKVFETEDLPMIEAIQERIGSAEFWDLKPVLLKNDSAAVSARRILSEKIRQEQEGS